MAANDCTHTNHESTTTNLNDGSTYLIEDIDGLLDAPVKASSAELPSTPPAEVPTGTVWKARILRIKVHVDLPGKTYPQMWTNASALIAAFAADTRDTELGILKYTSPAGTELWIDGHYDGHEMDKIAGIPRAVTIILRCPDPTFYAPTATEYTGNTFSGTSPVEIATNLAGDMPAYPTLTYGGTVTNAKVTDSRSRWYQLSDTVESGETLIATFNPLSKSFVHSVDGDWKDKRAVGSRLVEIPAGVSSLIFVGGDAGDDGAITISAKARYSRHA